MPNNYRVDAQDPLEDVIGFVKRSIAGAHRPIREVLDNLATTGRLVILFDGMDEMEWVDYVEKVERLNDFANAFRGQIRCLFACRTNDYLPSFAQQVRSYIDQNFPLPVTIEGPAFNAKGLTRRLLSS